MNKGPVSVLFAILCFAAPLTAAAAGEIFKVVNPDGSITYTDQKPAPNAQPVELKPLSVVETDIQVPEKAAAGDEAAQAEPTQRDLKRMYRDFRITQPAQEETFWGTGNQVLVSWGASEPLAEGMRVILYVNGEAQDAPAEGSVALTLDRGEHQVYAVLRDAGNRRLVSTQPVTFFVKQHSVNFNRQRANSGP